MGKRWQALVTCALAALFLASVSHFANAGIVVGGGAGSLAITLGIGNTTSGKNIAFTSGDAIVPAITGGNLALGSSSLLAGTIYLGAGSAGVASPPAITIRGTDASAANAAGLVTLRGGDNTGTSDGGSVTLLGGGVGAASAGSGGTITLQPGNAGTGGVSTGGPAGALTFSTGSFGTAAGGWTVTGGTAGGTGDNDVAAGASFTLKCPKGRGTGAGGSFDLQAAFPLASGSTIQTHYDRFYVVGQTKTLSNTSATTTTFCQMAVATANTAAGGRVDYAVIADDGAGNNVSVASGYFLFAGVNSNGTVTTSDPTTVEFSVTTTGTLVNAAFATVTGTNINLRIKPTWTTIVPTTVRIQYTVTCFGRTTVSPQ